jgi:ubiquitin thioesterase OTU1
MRARYKGPDGTGIVELPNDATVQSLFDELRTKTGISSFTLKYGPPTSMTSLDLSQGDAIAASLGLNGQTLTIVPTEARPLTPPPAGSTSNDAADLPQRTERPSRKSPDEISVPWPERDGILCKESRDEIIKRQLTHYDV